MVMYKAMCKKLPEISPAFAAALTVAFVLYSGLFGFSAVRSRRQNYSFYSLLPADKVTELSGTVFSNPIKTSSGRFYSVVLNAESASSAHIKSSASGQTLVFLPAADVEALYPGKLFSKAHSAVFAEQGARLTCSVRYANAFFIAEKTVFNGWKNRISRFRALCRLNLKRILYAWKKAGGLALALLSGSREYADERLVTAFKNSGLSHVLALSGMHLALFAGSAAALGRFVGKKLSVFMSLLFVCAFVWFAGATPSLIRSFLYVLIMFVCDICFVKPQTPSSSFDCLSAAFLVHVFLFPKDAYTSAFMLSYAAVLGIIVFESAVCPYLYKLLPRAAAKVVGVSVGAWAFTAPISIVLFGQFAPIGILSSPILSPLVAVFTVTSLVCITLSFAMPFLLTPLGSIIRALYALLEHAVMYFARFKPIVFN